MDTTYTKHEPQFDRLEIIDDFIVVSVVTVLCIRGFLTATGFPQIGGDGLHIAHVLWGGLTLTIALLVCLLSSRPNKPLMAIIGGIGFGFFIDEIGKFVTSNNNYFFSGSFFLIYVTLMLIWLVSRLIIVRAEKRPFFMNATWPKKSFDRNLVVTWAIGQIMAAIPIAGFFVVRNTHHPLIDIFTCIVILGYASAITTSLIYVARKRPDKGARMMQRSILFSIALLLPALYFEFATLASICAVLAILVMIDLSEISLKNVLRLRTKH